MSFFNRQKHGLFFPEKVYRCPCLIDVIDECHLNDLNSFAELHDEVMTFVLERGIPKVYTIKCGENLKDCIFCCSTHLSIMVLGKKKYNCTAQISFENLTIYYNQDKQNCVGETFCKGCIKKYLRDSIGYFYFKEF